MLCLWSQIVDHNSSSGFGLTHLLLPLLSVCVSLSAGLLGGSLISLALQHQLHNRLAALLVGTHLVGGHTSTALAYRSAQGTGVMMMPGRGRAGGFPHYRADGWPGMWMPCEVALACSI